LKCQIEHVSESTFQNIVTYKCYDDLLAHKEMLQNETLKLKNISRNN